ncbi:MAG: hypothetical protein COZ93_00855 [Nitrospirae bacterium CG_4_8_14_3_um_filter_44_28]|nr:MAG: hypothetical protein COZ93_00855 [Nitrospirae bacterium CG_4_8_14_3_um_filter_44_28]
MKRWKSILLVIALGAATWIADSLIDALLFRERTITSQIFIPAPHEIWMRFLIWGGILLLLHIRFTVAARRAAEQAITESEERYRILFDNAHDMIQSVAPDGRFIFVNPAWLKILGYTPEDLKAVAIFDILHPDNKQHCMEIFKRVMSGENVDNIETTFIAKDGRFIDVEGSVSAKMSGETAVAAEGIFRDITRRKKAEEQLKNLLRDVTRAKTEWEMTFDNSMEIILLLDKDLNITRYNKRFTDFVGLPPQELLGRKCYDFFTCNPAETGHCLGKIHDGELREWTEVKTNSGHWFYISHCPIIDEKGEFLHSIVIAADVTSLKNTQQRLQASEEELDSLFINFVKVMVNALDAKSPWTKGHSERVANYAEQIAEEMGLAEDDIKDIQLSGLLHDIGKIGTYDYLLDKPSKLTEEEFDAVKKHPVQGAAILKEIKQLKNIIPLIKYHHERVDGKGYPEGLRGERIPLCARILHVADSFDSMTADRPYRPSPGKEYAISELKRCNGTRFDPRVVEAFLKVISRL